ncbi:MAG: response regulator transcription factor [Acidimicrobiales bacterium]
MIRVLVVDDQELVRSGFRMILEAEDDIVVVAVASDGLKGVEACRLEKPDVVLMDVRMPNLDGVEATRQICERGRSDDPRVIILTTFDLDEYVYAALSAGASGFLLKDAPPDDLVNAVRVVAAGDALLAPSVTRRLIEDYASGKKSIPTPNPAIESLTTRENEVLRLIAKGLSNAEIASELFLGETTVKTHVGRVLMKLAVRDRVQAVVAAYECGLVTPGS